jgi:hypothetical protein
MGGGRVTIHCPDALAGVGRLGDDSVPAMKIRPYRNPHDPRRGGSARIASLPHPTLATNCKTPPPQISTCPLTTRLGRTRGHGGHGGGRVAIIDRKPCQISTVLPLALRHPSRPAPTRPIAPPLRAAHLACPETHPRFPPPLIIPLRALSGAIAFLKISNLAL